LVGDYLASQTTGQATIFAHAAPGSTNELDFTGGVTDQNLWFIQSGNDLKIDLLGTNTSVTVNSWFSSSSNQLQEITAGGLKIDNQISQLVQAMATTRRTTRDLTQPRPASLQFPMTVAFRTPWPQLGIVDVQVRSGLSHDARVQGGSLTLASKACFGFQTGSVRGPPPPRPLRRSIASASSIPTERSGFPKSILPTDRLWR
jgi:hypothetical protein